MTVELERITTRFEADEDRIRLLGQSKQGNVLVLWFTQRLLNRVVSYCGNWLEQSLQSGVPAAMQRVQQGFAQQVAQLALQQSVVPPVQVPQFSVQMTDAALVYAVDITQSESGLRLVFKDAQGRVHAALLLLAATLLQWLNILREQYLKAGWSLQSWPQWLQGPAETSLARSSFALLH